MGIEINRPGAADTFKQKPKLSAAGKIIIGAGLAAVLVICVIIASSISSGNKKSEKEDALLETIERGVIVCESAFKTLGADSSVTRKFNGIIDKVNAEKKAAAKAAAAYEAIDLALKEAAGNASVTDELNGTRNRIFYALKNYNAQ
ncbi:MAG: hypothetical protein LBL35_02680 [Clostridiales bacterium]|jgi:hypothetical protein|nr:hypothetical protein [Clostridiales bacterium]